MVLLDEYVDTNDHFQSSFVFPYCDTALTRRNRRSHEEPQPPPRWKRSMQEQLLENNVLSVLCLYGAALPAPDAAVEPVHQRRPLGESTLEDRAYRRSTSKRAVRFTEMEYAIPRADARGAVERVLELIERRQLPILFPLEVRFSAPDDAFLLTAFGRDTCYVAVHQYTGMEFETYFRAVEQIMDSYGGRPHWGKRHYQTAAIFEERYPAWDRFQAVGERLDPQGRSPTTTPGGCWASSSTVTTTLDPMPTAALPDPFVRPRMRGVLHQWAFPVSLVICWCRPGDRRPAPPALGIATLIYALSVAALLGTSALYHRVDWRTLTARRWMRRRHHHRHLRAHRRHVHPIVLLILHGTHGMVILVGGVVRRLPGAVFKSGSMPRAGRWPPLHRRRVGRRHCSTRPHRSPSVSPPSASWLWAVSSTASAPSSTPASAQIRFPRCSATTRCSTCSF